MEIAAAAAAAAESDEEDEEPAVGVGKMRAARDRGARNGEFTNPVGGRGMIGSAKAAFRQPHYVDDIKFFPTLVLRTAAVWPVFLIVVATVAICLTRITKDTTVASDELVNIAVQFVLNPMPMLMPMLAGYLAPRATWLAGAVAGGLGVLGLVLLMVLTSLKVEGIGTLEGGMVVGLTLQLLSVALPIGALFGAASGWYKRFLSGMQAANPRPMRGSASKKPVARSGKPAGR
jgi:hypothetical protein